jgi:hypothetical protein
MNILHHDLKTIKDFASAYCTSFTKFSAKFSFTIPSEAAKKQGYFHKIPLIIIQLIVPVIQILR